MKNKTFLSAFFFLTAFLSVAQNFECTPSHNIDEPIQEENFSFHEIRMITSDLSGIEFKWNLIDNTLPVDWSYSLCDLGGCYVGIPESGIMDPITTEQAQEGFMGFLKLNITASNFYGEGDVVFYVHEIGDESFGDTITMHITHADPLSSLEESLFSNVEVYPNPVQTILYFSTPSDFKSAQVLGTDGSIHATIHTEQNVDFTSYPVGLYFLKLEDAEGNVYTQKIFKN